MHIIIITTLIFNSLNAQEVKLNTNKSNISWTGKAAFNSYSLTGSLNVKNGTMIIQNNTVEMLFIEIDMKSLNHENKDLKRHLKSSDFFDVKRFAIATFKLTKPTKIVANKKLELIGNMMIKNQIVKETIPITIEFAEYGWKITFNALLNRLDYNVTFNSPSVFKKLKDNAIADEFSIKGELHFN